MKAIEMLWNLTEIMEEVQEVSEENALKAKITKSATEKCDREIVSKMKAFQDLN